MNRFILQTLVLLLTLGAPLAHADGILTGFVNTAKILELAPQAKVASERLEEEFAPRDSELVTLQKNLNTQEEKLARDGALMTMEERRKIESEIRSQEREMKRLRDAFAEDLNLRRNEELSRLQQEMGDAIVQIAKQTGYDLILETGVIYASERADLTEKVLELLQKQFDSGNKKKTK